MVITVVIIENKYKKAKTTAYGLCFLLCRCIKDVSKFTERCLDDISKMNKNTAILSQ